MDNVDNLSTKNVDNLDITACFVESVDKLSTLFVDNFYLAMSVWIMWITCPQGMWINRISQFALWKVWISYPQCLWISGSERKVKKVTGLSTVIVDNLVENCAEV